jgi:hypothetical protein
MDGYPPVALGLARSATPGIWFSASAGSKSWRWRQGLFRFGRGSSSTFLAYEARSSCVAPG